MDRPMGGVLSCSSIDSKTNSNFRSHYDYGYEKVRQKYSDATEQVNDIISLNGYWLYDAKQLPQ